MLDIYCGLWACRQPTAAQWLISIPCILVVPQCCVKLQEILVQELCVSSLGSTGLQKDATVELMLGILEQEAGGVKVSVLMLFEQLVPCSGALPLKRSTLEPVPLLPGVLGATAQLPVMTWIAGIPHGRDHLVTGILGGRDHLVAGITRGKGSLVKGSPVTVIPSDRDPQVTVNPSDRDPQ